MGSKVGHVLPAIGYLLIGLWHLFNHTKLHARHPNSYTFHAWFPISKSKYLELYVIMVACTMDIVMELFVGPSRHQPLDTDGTIPSNHLHTFEHSLISMAFFTYAALSILLDKVGIETKAKHDLTQLLGATAFALQLLLFHFHSTDHTGLEGQYHLTLQILTLVTLFTILIGMGYPKSFLINFLRSASVVFQGAWMIVMGYMLWTPGLIPKGCFMNLEDGRYIVRCHSDKALYRAKSLANILFSWFVIMLASFTIAFYLIVVKKYGNNDEYRALVKGAELVDGNNDDVEAKKENGGFVNFLCLGKFGSTARVIDMRRQGSGGILLCIWERLKQSTY